MAELKRASLRRRCASVTPPIGHEPAITAHEQLRLSPPLESVADADGIVRMVELHIFRRRMTGEVAYM